MRDVMLIVEDTRVNREILKAIFNHKFEIIETTCIIYP